MSLLTIVQDVAVEVGLNSPNAAASSTDDNIIRIVKLANREGKSLARRFIWSILTQEATHTSLAAESQGLMTAIAGSDFGWIKNDTLWDRDIDRPLNVVSDTEWAHMKANGITGPYTNVRIRGGYLIANPTPTAGHTWAFEWVSKNWCESSGGTGQSAFAADTDVGRLDEEILTLGTIWRYLKSQGLEYGEEFRTYEIAVNDAMARDGANKRILMRGNRGTEFITKRSVSEGSWSL